MPRKQKCSVCSAKTSSNFYGAVVCDACRTFFRRCILNSKPNKCVSNVDQCNINYRTRRDCSSCRYQKCLSVGMKPELVEYELNKRQQIWSNLENSAKAKKWRLATTGSTSLVPNLQPSETILGKTNSQLEWIKDVNGLISETNCQIQRFLTSKGTPRPVQFFMRGLPQLVFTSKYDCHVLKKIEESTDVMVFQSSQNKPFSLRSVSPNLWNRLTQIIPAAHQLMRIGRIRRISSDSNTKYITLQQSIENNTNAITSAVEAIDLFQKLPFEEQMFFLREGLVGVMFLFTPYLYQEDNRLTFFASQDQVTSMTSFGEGDINSEINRAYIKLLRVFPVCLRKDAFVVSLLCLVYFFQENPNLSSNDDIYREQSYYTNLLDIYIQGKIQAGHWSEEYQELWKSISRIMNIVNYVHKNGVYEKFEKDEQQRIAEQMGNEMMWVKEIVDTEVKYRLVKFVWIPRLLFQTVIQVKLCNGLISGTNYSCQELITKDLTKSNFSLMDSQIICRYHNGRHRIFRKIMKGDTLWSIEVHSALDYTVARMQNMTNDHWDRLCQVINAIPFLQRGVEFSAELLHTQDIDSQHFALSASWSRAMEAGVNFFHALPLIQSLPSQDQEILIKNTGYQPAIIQMATNFDKGSNSIMFYGLGGQIQVGIRMQSFQKYSTSGIFYDPLFYELNDKVRQDQVFMSLLSVIGILSNHQDLLCKDVVLQEKRFFMQLLTSYVQETLSFSELTDVFKISHTKTQVLGFKAFSQDMLFNQLH